MRELHFTVPEAFDGVMGKVFLRTFCGISTRLMLSLKQVENGMTADGRLLRTIDRVKTGQEVVLRLPDVYEHAQAAVAVSVPVAYEDDDILVFNKPADMPVHPSAGHAEDTLANAAAYYLAQKGVSATFRPINRLDRDTTGLVVTAKNPFAAARLSGTVEKIYFAVIEGLKTGAGTIDAPLRRMEGHGIRREIGVGGETAVTHWKALGTFGNHTLIRAIIETGRTHQIRAHFSSLGYPLAGDDMYDGHRTLMMRQALHCSAVRLVQPVTHETLVLSAPLPEDMGALLTALGADLRRIEPMLKAEIQEGFAL